MRSLETELLCNSEITATLSDLLYNLPAYDGNLRL